MNKEISYLAKLLIFSGAGILILGLVLLLLSKGKIPFLGRLPGDILIKRGNFTFYFPLTSCVILSLILSLILSIFFRK